MLNKLTLKDNIRVNSINSFKKMEKEQNNVRNHVTSLRENDKRKTQKHACMIIGPRIFSQCGLR